ncbi:hypothetical protein [Lentilactobacillus hilgardii]|uniref:hypothetical protein n=1 Tax=Lentilactobacillus hilgardii TaxID=1588 RepID=UPI00019C4898|nr:hypothetical protein [Lentilactobacillus hilgardii]EEI20316.1 hypothetical protein HMPREF0497_0885 [Lentilactobacillus buchneri ATCC 11577]MCP9333691.1 hypothetical protein [Lentilactobacillus hilgardii]MCP9350265.1 hypothetical protein [Lentilactobacillus hilgardii]MCP9353141.1 hypothetical protein [Lentilactobacillus hilgardii]MCT3396933.1 hypothetical protein [Lentilactobacillus hilgardii]
MAIFHEVTKKQIKQLVISSKLATKAIKTAGQRITALQNTGFKSTKEALVGHDGTKYVDYFVYDL